MAVDSMRKVLGSVLVIMTFAYYFWKSVLKRTQLLKQKIQRNCLGVMGFRPLGKVLDENIDNREWEDSLLGKCQENSRRSQNYVKLKWGEIRKEHHEKNIMEWDRRKGFEKKYSKDEEEKGFFESETKRQRESIGVRRILIHRRIEFNDGNFEKSMLSSQKFRRRRKTDYSNLLVEQRRLEADKRLGEEIEIRKKVEKEVLESWRVLKVSESSQSELEVQAKLYSRYVVTSSGMVELFHIFCDLLGRNKARNIFVGYGALSMMLEEPEITFEHYASFVLEIGVDQDDLWFAEDDTDFIEGCTRTIIEKTLNGPYSLFHDITEYNQFGRMFELIFCIIDSLDDDQQMVIWRIFGKMVERNIDKFSKMIDLESVFQHIDVEDSSCDSSDEEDDDANFELQRKKICSAISTVSLQFRMIGCLDYERTEHSVVWKSIVGLLGDYFSLREPLVTVDVNLPFFDVCKKLNSIYVMLSIFDDSDYLEDFKESSNNDGENWIEKCIISLIGENLEIQLERDVALCDTLVRKCFDLLYFPPRFEHVSWSRNIHNDLPCDAQHFIHFMFWAVENSVLKISRDVLEYCILPFCSIGNITKNFVQTYFLLKKQAHEHAVVERETVSCLKRPSFRFSNMFIDSKRRRFVFKRTISNVGILSDLFIERTKYSYVCSVLKKCMLLKSSIRKFVKESSTSNFKEVLTHLRDFSKRNMNLGYLDHMHENFNYFETKDLVLQDENLSELTKKVESITNDYSFILGQLKERLIIEGVDAEEIFEGLEDESSDSDSSSEDNEIGLPEDENTKGCDEADEVIITKCLSLCSGEIVEIMEEIERENDFAVGEVKESDVLENSELTLIEGLYVNKEEIEFDLENILKGEYDAKYETEKIYGGCTVL